MKNAEKHAKRTVGRTARGLACGAFVLFFALFASAARADTDRFTSGLFSVDMTWGAMTFMYQTEDEAWHVYDAASEALVEDTGSEVNRIEITCAASGAEDVTVTLSYIGGYSGASGFFTPDSGTVLAQNDGSFVVMRLGVSAASGTVYFMPTGVDSDILDAESYCALGHITVSFVTMPEAQQMTELPEETAEPVAAAVEEESTLFIDLPEDVAAPVEEPDTQAENVEGSAAEPGPVAEPEPVVEPEPIPDDAPEVLPAENEE